MVMYRGSVHSNQHSHEHSSDYGNNEISININDKNDDNCYFDEEATCSKYLP